LKKKLIFFFKNSKIHAIKAGLQFQDSTGNMQRNSPKTALPCPQMSSNVCMCRNNFFHLAENRAAALQKVTIV